MVYYLFLISTSILFFKLNSVNGARTLYEGDQCVSHTGMTGICTKTINCSSALQMVKDSQNNNFIICGYHKADQIVCCMDNLISKSGEPKPGLRKTAQGEPKPGLRKTAQVCKFYKENFPQITASHILGGQVTSPGEFPHMVAVGYMNGNMLDFSCGGTLISKRYVLTAAHCTKTREGVNPHLARMGAIDIFSPLDDSNFKDYIIEAVIRHPKYLRSLKYNDIALLRLTKNVELTTEILPACLSTDLTDPTETVFATGWGVTTVKKKERSKQLLSAALQPFALDTCNNSYLELKVDSIPSGIIDSQLCAYDPDGKRDACEGDSGGPLQIGKLTGGTHTVVGVISFAVSCGEKPGVYTRVSTYLDWIESIVWPDELSIL